MKYLLILLFPILSYSQNIGDKFNFEGMTQIEYTSYNLYVYESRDSICEISVSKDNTIVAVDYVISREKVSKNKLKWITKYTQQIGENMYYEDGSYIFILPQKDHFLIQKRCVGLFL